jgi:hypothetical protein
VRLALDELHVARAAAEARAEHERREGRGIAAAFARALRARLRQDESQVDERNDRTAAEAAQAAGPERADERSLSGPAADLPATNTHPTMAP